MYQRFQPLKAVSEISVFSYYAAIMQKSARFMHHVASAARAHHTPAPTGNMKRPDPPPTAAPPSTHGTERRASAIPDPGPNPGEGVPESEPGGPNRASDSAALGTVYVITSPHQSSETGGLKILTEHSRRGSAGEYQLAVRDFSLGQIPPFNHSLCLFSRFPFPAIIAQPFPLWGRKEGPAWRM